MVEKFIERGTDYNLRHGKLSIYETNCTCKDIKFFFNQYVLTLMLSGHKTIVSKNLKFEFFPGTFFIPEPGVINTVSIPNASIYNPTKCLVLELTPSFVEGVYEEILYSDQDKDILFDSGTDSAPDYFLSNDSLLIKAFVKLYDLQHQDHSLSKEAIETLIIKEMLYRIFTTEGLSLLKRNFTRSVSNDKIRNVIAHIKDNLGKKLTTSSLARIAGLGQTTFFKEFKDSTGHSPIEYLMLERIHQAKILIQKNQLDLQDIAYRCGFNSYEYFCSTFKRVEKVKPSDFRRREILEAA